MSELVKTTQKSIPTGVSTSRMLFGRVGIITNGFESAYFNHLVEAASNYLSARGMQAVVQSKLPLLHDELETLTALSESACDGLIIHADTVSDIQLGKFMQQHPNSVLLNRKLNLFPDRCVHLDNICGGALAARFLVAQGHKHIAMVRGPEQYFEANDRAVGFKQELEDHHLVLEAEIYGDFLQHDGATAMEKILNNRSKITAVFFQNDEMAFGAMHACKRLGVKVPEELSIIGYDDVAMTEYVTPKLTSIKQPLRQIAEHAARIVCDLILDEDIEKRATGCGYTPVLVERESVSPPAGILTEKVALTQREAECLTWTANGKTSWEISVILGVSESTATFHLRNAGVKLKASNRAHAVAKALHAGLISFS